MRYVLMGLLWLTTMPCFASAAVETGDFGPLLRAAKNLDSGSRSGLGVGIRSLALLFDANSVTYTPKWVLEKNGNWPLLLELQRRGYITMSMSAQLPDGTAPGGEFVNYQLTKKGIAVMDAFMAVSP
jgi:hypothetical protein